MIHYTKQERVEAVRRKMKELCPVCWQDTVILVVVMTIALDMGLLLQPVGADDSHAALIFVAGVLLVARYTNGYLYGIAASLTAAIVVNYAFLSPYYQFEPQEPGYLLTFATLFLVSIVTSTLTTHIKEQEEIRIEAERERLRANLLRAVGHDLRTPLTSIIGSAEAMLDPENHFTPEEEHTLLENVRSEGEWLIRMVENLLSITRMGRSACHLQKSMEAPEEVIGEAVGKFQKHFPHIEVEVVLPQAWLEVPMDAMLVEQVLYNLMENAVIHGEANTVILQVSREKGWARFSVRDDGTGIPQERLALLWGDYMELAERGGGDKKQNMGLGLALCRDIVTVHGGAMEARNLREGGTEFCFTLPLKEERQHGAHKG